MARHLCSGLHVSISAAVVALVMVACSGESAAPEQQVGFRSEPVSTEKVKPPKGDPPQEIKRHGRLFQRQGKAKLGKPREREIADQLRQADSDKGTVDVRKLSEKELGDLFRSRLLHQGFEYIEATPPSELARKIKQSIDVAPPETTGQEVGPKPAPLGASPEPLGYSIVGTDNRARETSSAWSNSTQLFVDFGDGSWCSASMISKRVAVSAAHCFYFNGQWYDWLTTNITPAASNTAPQAPFGTTPYFDVYLPGGWTGTQLDLDYARIEFWEDNPGCLTGWLGTASPQLSNAVNLVAYPGDKPIPQMWRSSGSITGFVGGRTKHNSDVVYGNAGAGIYKTSSKQVGAIQSREVTSWNEGVTWNSAVYAFFNASECFPALPNYCSFSGCVP